MFAIVHSRNNANTKAKKNSEYEKLIYHMHGNGYMNILKNLIHKIIL